MASSWIGKKVTVYNGLVNSMTEVTQRGLQPVTTGTLTAVDAGGHYGTVNGTQYLMENMLLASGGRKRTRTKKVLMNRKGRKSRKSTKSRRRY
jgi:hypothetical protein